MGFGAPSPDSASQRLANLQAELSSLEKGDHLSTLQERLLQDACQTLDAEKGALILIDETNAEWAIRKSLGSKGKKDEACDGSWEYSISPHSEKGGLIWECLSSAEAVLSNDLATDPRYNPASDAPGCSHATSMLCTPMIMDGEVLGAIQVLDKRGGVFDAHDQDLLELIASIGANAVHNTRLIQKLKITNAELEANRWELQGSINTLRALFDNLPAALYIVDPAYKIVAINQSRARHASQEPLTLVGQICYQALFGLPTHCPGCRVSETLQDGASTLRSDRREANKIARDREREVEDGLDWEISTYPIFDEDGKIIQAILLEQDVTDKRHLEGILARSEKLAVIGQLAAGVAHEINNPLTAIIANAQILRRELPPTNELQESVDLIARAGARATQVIGNLLDFARKEEYRLGLTDVNETVNQALELVQHELVARGVRLRFQPDSKLPPILASEDHLQSVWLNLLLNAIDAMDKSPGEIKVTTAQAGSQILVCVTDNGKGIPSERLTHIFEPFYTTKAPGRGTGLGLSVAHRIVKQHGGNIRVESKVDEGSQFTVLLPTG